MSTSLRHIEPARKATLPNKKTPEQRYWDGFASTQLVKEHNAVTHIHFDANKPHDFAVTSSTRVQIFSAKTRKVAKSFTRFKDTVYCGEIRQDGKLMVAGDASGLVQIYDAQHTRNLLVTLQPSSHPTQVTKFHPSVLTQLLVCSDDRYARLYDISQTQKPLADFGGHEDYVRSGVFMPGSGLVVTGCYDNVVRVFDPRANTEDPVLRLNQGAPVEEVLALNTTTLVSCGDNGIKAWDLAAGKCVQTVNPFTKTVTSLASAGERGILAGSMDGHVKVIDTNSTAWQVTYDWKFGSGVLSCGVSPNSKHLVVGLNSGLLTIRTRKTEPKVPQGVKAEHSHAFQRMMRGSEYHGEAEFHIVDDKPKGANAKKLKPWERDLFGFRWADALDDVLTRDVPNTAMIVTCMEELRKRGKVRAALSGRSEADLQPILRFCDRQLSDARLVPLIADYLGCVVEMYSDFIETHPVLVQMVQSIQQKVDDEIVRCEQAQQLQGMLELLSVGN